MKHTTLSGQVIEYEADAALEAYIARVRKALDNLKVSEGELTALIYGKENPLLDQNLFAARGAVTAEVLKEPAYHVLADFLVRKRVQREGTDPATLGAKYTLTVAEAAKRKGVTEDGIRKAIRERRLPAWFKDGTPFLDPTTLDAVTLGKRGPTTPQSNALAFKVGYSSADDVSFRLWVSPHGDQPQGINDGPPPQGTRIHSGRVRGWQRAAVLSGGGGKLRFFELVPSTEEDPEPITFHQFYVKGNFSIIRKVNNAKDARAAWELRADPPAKGRSYYWIYLGPNASKSAAKPGHPFRTFSGNANDQKGTLYVYARADSERDACRQVLEYWPDADIKPLGEAPQLPKLAATLEETTPITRRARGSA